MNFADKLRYLYKQSTQGEWIVWGYTNTQDMICIKPQWLNEVEDERELHEAEQLIGADEGYSFHNPTDAHIICLLRNKVPELQALIDAASKVYDLNHNKNCPTATGFFMDEKSAVIPQCKCGLWDIIHALDKLNNTQP
jgi:hypothetical protein